MRIAIKHEHCMSMQFSPVNLSTDQTFYNVVAYLLSLELQTGAMVTETCSSFSSFEEDLPMNDTRKKVLIFLIFFINLF